ncbi:hypothetical protein KSU66_20345 [Sporosarcina sp. G11-34]|nr:hypothetical protein [Sporosarcina sp. G11-34]
MNQAELAEVALMITATIDDGSVAGAIHGVNVAFHVAGYISFFGLLLSFTIRDSKQNKHSTEV